MKQSFIFLKPYFVCLLFIIHSAQGIPLVEPIIPGESLWNILKRVGITLDQVFTSTCSICDIADQVTMANNSLVNINNTVDNTNQLLTGTCGVCAIRTKLDSLVTGTMCDLSPILNEIFNIQIMLTGPCGLCVITNTVSFIDQLLTGTCGVCAIKSELDVINNTTNNMNQLLTGTCGLCGITNTVGFIDQLLTGTCGVCAIKSELDIVNNTVSNISQLLTGTCNLCSIASTVGFIDQLLTGTCGVCAIKSELDVINNTVTNNNMLLTGTCGLCGITNTVGFIDQLLTGTCGVCAIKSELDVINNTVINNNMLLTGTCGLCGITNTVGFIDQLLTGTCGVCAIKSELDVINNTTNSMNQLLTGTCGLCTISSQISSLNACSLPITQANVGTTGFTINTPGGYALASNIVFSPVSANNAITINASDVTLDLGCFSLNQGNLTAGCNAIVVNSNLRNVRIKNGFIEFWTGKGIVVNQGVINVGLDTITTFSCNLRGIDFVGASANFINDINMSLIEVSNCCYGIAGDFGISLSQCAGIKANNIRIDNCGIASHDFSALRIDSCTGGMYNDVRSGNCLGAVNVRGVHMTNTVDAVFTSNIMRSLSAASNAATVVGFDFLASNTANYLINCFSLGHTGTTTGSTVICYKVDAGNNDNLLANCIAARSQGSTNTIGILTQNNSFNSFFDCIIQRNIAMAGNVTAISLIGCTGNIFLRNVITGQTAVAGTAIGINIDSASTACFFKENVVTNNQGSTNATSFGIVTAAASTNNPLVQNIATENGTVAANQLNGLVATQVNNVSINNVNSIGQSWTNVGLT